MVTVMVTMRPCIISCSKYNFLGGKVIPMDVYIHTHTHTHTVFLDVEKINGNKETAYIYIKY